MTVDFLTEMIILNKCVTQGISNTKQKMKKFFPKMTEFVIFFFFLAYATCVYLQVFEDCTFQQIISRSL